MKQNGSMNAGIFPGGAQGKKIAERKSELEALAAEEDGQRVKEMLGGDNGIEKMLESGDTDAVRKALGSALKTPEGARLLLKLRDIMK